MRYHMIAFVGGFFLDLLLGDPYFLPHPVRLIGRLIAGMEKQLREKEAVQKDETDSKENPAKGEDGQKAEMQNRIAGREWKQGTGLVCSVLLCVGFTVSIFLLAAYWVHPYLGTAVECLMTYQILAIKSLKTESMKVYHALQERNLEQARAAVSMIVGRDTMCLDEEGIAKAAVETVAENTSDGVIAPMLYLALGGPVLGFLCKAVNTMDSMIGYRNEKYRYFGRTAAKLDDVVNYIPARVSAVLMIIVCFLADRDFSAKDAWRIYCRDRRKHASPNAAQTESVCAGALGIRLAGDASYFEKLVRKPYIGDAKRSVEYEDIRRANRLLYGTAWLGEVLCVVGMGILSNI